MLIGTVHVFHDRTHTSYSLNEWFYVENPEGAFCYFNGNWFEVINGVIRGIHPDGVPTEYRTMLLILT